MCLVTGIGRTAKEPRGCMLLSHVCLAGLGRVRPGAIRPGYVGGQGVLWRIHFVAVRHRGLCLYLLMQFV